VEGVKVIMHNQYRLFTEVSPFYASLLDALSAARQSISMMYLIYDHGAWSARLNEVLIEKHRAGVKVRIMPDFLGTVLDHPWNIRKNFLMLKRLGDQGLNVTLFNSTGSPRSFFDRLHIKMCAIDDHLLFLGGSNIGDYYTNWQDTNFRVEGDLQGVGHALFDCVAARTRASNNHNPQMELSDCRCGDARLVLTLPGTRRDIYRCLVEMISTAASPVYFRYWYFMPNSELLDVMLAQLARGIELRIILSNWTRIPFIDIANRYTLRRLARAGAAVYRYRGRYMHSKIIWTESGDVLIGSANLEMQGMNHNYELCMKLNDVQLVDELSESFWADAEKCKQVGYEL
jgi:cardiolipin synthase